MYYILFILLIILDNNRYNYICIIRLYVVYVTNQICVTYILMLYMQYIYLNIITYITYIC